VSDNSALVCNDVNECNGTVPATGLPTDQTNNCNQYAKCTNTQGSFTCACATVGYKDANEGPDEDGTSCVPICGDGLVMKEEDCDLGYNAQGCTAECMCDTGWQKSAPDVSAGGYTFCEDLDECVESGANNCDAQAVCTNTQGSFTCACRTGYEDRSDAQDGSLCVSTDCGDGIRTSNEACDDGNTAAGDGCDVRCQVETGFVCEGGSDSSADTCLCAENYYPHPDAGSEAPPCSRLCAPDGSSCSSRGSCHPSFGYCLCDAWYFEADCSVELTPMEETSVALLAGEAAEISLSGLRLTIPEGALTEAVTIAAALFTAGDLPSSMLPARRAARRQGITFHSSLADLKPDGLTFAKDATLEMIPDSDAENLRIGTFDADAEKWVVVEGSKVQGSAGEWLPASIDHFSLYAVVNAPGGVPPAPPPPTSNSSVLLQDPPGPLIIDPDNMLPAILGAVIGGVLLVGCAVALVLYQRYLSQKPPKLVFEDKFVEPIPGLQDLEDEDEDDEQPDWGTCSGCEKPVRFTWVRCPSCRCEVPPQQVRVPKRMYTDEGFDKSVLLPSLDDDDLEDLLPPRKEPTADCIPCLRAAPGADALARRKARVKQADFAKGDLPYDLEDHPLVSEFTSICLSCQAPMKPSWERCPLCKAPAGVVDAHDDDEAEDTFGEVGESFVGAELHTDTSRQDALSPDGVSNALFTGQALFPRPAADDFHLQDLAPESAASAADRATRPHVSLSAESSVVEAAEVGLQLDALEASAEVPEARADLDSKALATLSNFLDGVSSAGEPDIRSETGTMATFATGLGTVEVDQAVLEGQSMAGLDSVSAVSLGPAQADAGGTSDLDEFSITGLESTAARLEGQGMASAAQRVPALEKVEEADEDANTPMAAAQLGLYLDGMASAGSVADTNAGTDADAMSNYTAFDRPVPRPHAGSIAGSSVIDAADVGLNLDAMQSQMESQPISGLQSGTHSRAAQEQLDQYLGGMTRTVDGSVADTNAGTDADAMSNYTAFDRPVPRPHAGSIAGSSVIDAADVGLNLDALTSQMESQPISDGDDLGLTWEQERQAALAGSRDDEILVASSSVNFYAPSEMSGKSDERGQEGTQIAGLQSIDEQREMAVDAIELGLNLDALEDSASSELARNESKAEAALNQFIASDLDTSVVSASQSRFDAMSSAASVDSRLPDPPPGRISGAQDQDDARSVSAVSVMSDMSSAIDGTAVPGLNLDALASSSIALSAAPRPVALESTETRFEPMEDPSMQSSMTQLPVASLTGLDALASSEIRVQEPQQQPPRTQAGLESVAEEVP